MLKLVTTKKPAAVVVGLVLALFLGLVPGQALAEDVRELKIGIGMTPIPSTRTPSVISHQF